MAPPTAITPGVIVRAKSKSNVRPKRASGIVAYPLTNSGMRKRVVKDFHRDAAAGYAKGKVETKVFGASPNRTGEAPVLPYDGQERFCRYQARAVSSPCATVYSGEKLKERCASS